MIRARTILLVVGGLALGGVAGAAAARGQLRRISVRDPSSSPSFDAIIVPRARGPIAIDGELTEAAWAGDGAVRSGAFSQRPYADARMVWQGGNLYFALYAADEDIRAARARHDGPLWLADSYKVTLRQGDHEYLVEISPAGVMTDARRERGQPYDFSWESGARFSVDRDGTLDQSSDDDEEWLVELAIPLAAVGLRGEPGETLGATIQRCDASRGATKRVCASWGEERRFELGR